MEYCSLGRDKNRDRHNGDHAFVVLGRAKFSDINDMSTWGEQAVVCDPWGNTAFIPSREGLKSQPNDMYQYIDRYRVIQMSDTIVGAGHSKHFYQKHRSEFGGQFWKSLESADAEVAQQPLADNTSPRYA